MKKKNFYKNVTFVFFFLLMTTRFEMWYLIKNQIAFVCNNTACWWGYIHYHIHYEKVDKFLHSSARSLYSSSFFKSRSVFKGGGSYCLKTKTKRAVRKIDTKKKFGKFLQSAAGVALLYTSLFLSFSILSRCLFFPLLKTVAAVCNVNPCIYGEK